MLRHHKVDVEAAYQSTKGSVLSAETFVVLIRAGLTVSSKSTNNEESGHTVTVSKTTVNNIIGVIKKAEKYPNRWLISALFMACPMFSQDAAVQAKIDEHYQDTDEPLDTSSFRRKKQMRNKRAVKNLITEDRNNVPSLQTQVVANVRYILSRAHMGKSVHLPVSSITVIPTLLRRLLHLDNIFPETYRRDTISWDLDSNLSKLRTESRIEMEEELSEEFETNLWLTDFPVTKRNRKHNSKIEIRSMVDTLSDCNLEEWGMNIKDSLRMRKRAEALFNHQ